MVHIVHIVKYSTCCTYGACGTYGTCGTCVTYRTRCNDSYNTRDIDVSHENVYLHIHTGLWL